MSDLIDWTIEESKLSSIRIEESKLLSTRRFPPHFTIIEKCFQGYIRLIMPIRKFTLKERLKKYLYGKKLPKIETTSPAGHRIKIDFETMTVIIDGEIYFHGFVYSFALSPDEIESDFSVQKTFITLRWARKNEGHLKPKKKTDIIVVDWKNIRYWINGIESTIR